jgi:hypothetical protein
MTAHRYELTESAGGVPVKSWTRGVPFEPEARQQLRNIAQLPLHSQNDRGAWGDPPTRVLAVWERLAPRFQAIAEKHRTLQKTNHLHHLGTNGAGRATMLNGRN